MLIIGKIGHKQIKRNFVQKIKCLGTEKNEKVNRKKTVWSIKFSSVFFIDM